MFSKTLLRLAITFSRYRQLRKDPVVNFRRNLWLSELRRKNDENGTQGKELTTPLSFEEIKEKNKNSYLDMIKIFINRDAVHRRGHVEFIYAALKNMEDFSVHKDLQVYKALIDVLPKGKFIPTNLFQAEFMHYPKQQQCVIDLLQQMEDNGVMPDHEMEDMLMNVFGEKGYALRKLWRMMYWMPKFKNLSPWPIPDPLPNDVFELAMIAIARISSADINSKVTVYQTAEIQESLEDTWIVSAQSPKQKELLEAHNKTEPIYVEGAFKVWIKNKAVSYFALKANPKPQKDDSIENSDDVSNIKVPLFNIAPPKKQIAIYPSVHEQDDGVIFALCATGTSSKDSLLSWIRHLEKDENPALGSIPVVFTLRSGEKEVTVAQDESKEKIEDH